ncbi:hypothetical protein [Clostridium thermobutyricum]|uniref:hypothetical protein n=1 Tax=Clostridium thermobutyricum TaxID=29372 RepID=UPI0018ABCCD0|nr:hypothetical protein [Clostridium thermobutyricum]
MYDIFGNLEKKYVEILKRINKYGLIKKSTLAKIYGKSFRYQNNRIMKDFNQLEQEKYLRSYGQSYGLGMRGKKLLREEKIEINYTELPTGQKAINLYKDNNLLLNLNFKNKLSRIEYIRYKQKMGKEVNKVRTFAGEVYNEFKKRYLIYRIDNELTNGKISLIISDIEKGNHDRIIIFLKSFEKLERLIKVINNIKVTELIILPNNEEGYMMLNEKNNNKFIDKNLQKFINGNIPNSFEMINNKIYFKEVFSVNLLVLDLKKMVRKIEEGILDKEPRINFFIGECYKEFFRNSDILIYKRNNVNLKINSTSINMKNYFMCLNKNEEN